MGGRRCDGMVRYGGTGLVTSVCGFVTLLCGVAVAFVGWSMGGWVAASIFVVL